MVGEVDFDNAGDATDAPRGGLLDQSTRSFAAKPELTANNIQAILQKNSHNDHRYNASDFQPRSDRLTKSPGCWVVWNLPRKTIPSPRREM